MFVRHDMMLKSQTNWQLYLVKSKLACWFAVAVVLIGLLFLFRWSCQSIETKRRNWLVALCFATRQRLGARRLSHRSLIPRECDAKCSALACVQYNKGRYSRGRMVLLYFLRERVRCFSACCTNCSCTGRPLRRRTASTMRLAVSGAMLVFDH